ncbi:MAG: hypothetical protein NUV84_04320 [Candidatus Uhrbacteria bacterium]|nr:hypothetical protein [Candidatus Uhrbacteria bacterium]
MNELSRERNMDPEAAFEVLIGQTDTETQKTGRYQKIIEDLDENGDYVAASEALMELLKNRDRWYSRGSSRIEVRVYKELNDFEIRLLQEIKDASLEPSRFLGQGLVAKVFSLRREGFPNDWHVCVKLVEDQVAYERVNTVLEETEILAQVSSLHVEGVRTPVPLFSISGTRKDGIAMEQLDAFHFHLFRDGKRMNQPNPELAKGFDVGGFFSRVRAFVAEMHRKGVYHLDLHSGNIMIDRKTGMPRIIDFGQSKTGFQIESSRFSVHETDEGSNQRREEVLKEYEMKDLDKLRETEIEIRKLLG